MVRVLSGFADELVKCARRERRYDKEHLQDLYAKVKRRQGKVRYGRIRKLRGNGHPESRDYLASMAILALAHPLLTLTKGKISRLLHNRQIMKALGRATKPREIRNLKREIYSLRSIGRIRPGMRTQSQPILTGSSLVGDLSSGALYGSAIQMLRDRYSGAKSVHS